MRNSLSISALALCVATPLAAQQYLDDFNHPNGANVPGWTQQRGTWQIQNGRVSATSAATWAYITKDGLTATNCVLDAEFFVGGTGVQFAGLTARHPGGSLDSNLLMVKIQNNGGVVDFDRVFSYERGAAGSTFADIPGGTQSAYCRMITLGNEFWMEVDADKDGIFELQLARRPISLVTAPGLVGMNAYQASEMDNFEYFDAVLLPQATSIPRPGSTYQVDLHTPTAGVPWMGALALGNAGVPIGARRIPLTPDSFLVGSLGASGLGLVGVTDANGGATLSIPIPPIPALVGARLFTAAFTLDPTQPLNIGHISNEQFFEIQP